MAMSFHEKSAWISLLSIALVGFIFFLHVPRTLTPAPSSDIFHALLICLVALVVIEIPRARRGGDSGAARRSGAHGRA